MSLFPRGVLKPVIAHCQLISVIPKCTRRMLSTQIDQITDSLLSETQLSVRQSIQKLCAQFPDTYWANADRTATYPIEFRKAITAAGWLGITLPTEYGGAGLGVSEATVMMQTIAESGAGVAGAQSIHANIYPLVPVAKFGTSEQKERWLQPLIDGENTACFGVTEPDVGSETYKLKTRAEKKGDKYIVNGQKIWISSALEATHILLLARTADFDPKSPTSGLSLFYTPLDRTHVTIRPIHKMGGRAIDSNELFIVDLPIPESDRLGPEGQGFKMVLQGMNAERCLLAGESIGTGLAALKRATQYAQERVVFSRPIGQNQGIAHPLAEAWMNLEAAKLLAYRAAEMFDKGEESSTTIGAYCNSAKYLSAEAAFKACERAVLTLGGMGYAQDYHVERYLREIFVPRIAPHSHTAPYGTPRRKGEEWLFAAVYDSEDSRSDGQRNKPGLQDTGRRKDNQLNAGVFLLSPTETQRDYVWNMMRHPPQRDFSVFMEQDFLRWAYRDGGPYPWIRLSHLYNTQWCREWDLDTVYVLHDKLWGRHGSELRGVRYQAWGEMVGWDVARYSDGIAQWQGELGPDNKGILEDTSG